MEVADFPYVVDLSTIRGIGQTLDDICEFVVIIFTDEHPGRHRSLIELTSPYHFARQARNFLGPGKPVILAVLDNLRALDDFLTLAFAQDGYGRFSAKNQGRMEAIRDVVREIIGSYQMSNFDPSIRCLQSPIFRPNKNYHQSSINPRVCQMVSTVIGQSMR